jgi:hypothetical protein
MKTSKPAIIDYQITSLTTIKISEQDKEAIESYGPWLRYGRTGDLVPKSSIGKGGSPRLRTLIAYRAGLIESLQSPRVIYAIKDPLDYSRENTGVRARIPSNPKRLEDSTALGVKVDKADHEFLTSLSGGLSRNVRAAIKLYRESIAEQKTETLDDKRSTTDS